MRAHLAALPGALALSALALSASAQSAAPGLEPYQIIRSLQLVQDRIADGDHAAVPMQRKILEMIDARLAHSTPEEFSDGRNFRALMIYAMSGGNPGTVSSVVSRLVLDENDARLGAGLVRYTKGELARASAALRDIEPRDAPADISPILALVKGTVLAAHEPQRSLSYLDYARLTGPGTLIEEAALRRSIALSAEIEDPERFMKASEQYVRRFLRSPYASQFADAFVAGLADLHATVDLKRITQVIAEMTPEQSKVIYLRIARQAAIDRLSNLLAFATTGLEIGAPGDGPDDPRAELYAALAAITSEHVISVKERLARIDASQLSASDRMLLDAARAIADDVVSLPKTASVTPKRPERDDVAGAAATLPRSEPGMPDDAAGNSMEKLPPKAAADSEPDSSGDFLAETRRRIEAVDKLLQETKP